MPLENAEDIKVIKHGRLISFFKYAESELVKAQQGICPFCKQKIIIEHKTIQMVTAIYCQYCSQKIDL